MIAISSVFHICMDFMIKLAYEEHQGQKTPILTDEETGAGKVQVFALSHTTARWQRNDVNLFGLPHPPPAPSPSIFLTSISDPYDRKIF